MPDCPRCGGPASHVFDAFDKNRATSDERFAYLRCDVCGVIWNPSPPEDLERYYSSDYHGAFPGKAELEAAADTERQRLRFLTQDVAPGRMVEIGPSHGVFAFAARRAGFDVTALEMDIACCRHLEAVVGVTAVNTADPAAVLATLEPSRAVAMWHVIEHVPEPWDLLRAVAENLEPGGVLGVATPNPHSLQARVFGARWVHLDAPRHITLIPLEALQEEARGLGLELRAAVTNDELGTIIGRNGWSRSVTPPPSLVRPGPRVEDYIGGAVQRVLAPVERRGLRGAAYTAVFRKAGA
jgi:SAM-dependent methyltransferase